MTQSQAAGAEQQYNVVFSYGTMAESPEDAVATALSAIDARSGAFVEVFPDGSKSTVFENELGLVTLPDAGPTLSEMAQHLRAAYDLLQRAGGTALGLAMSGSAHPNPDEALMGLQRQVQEISTGLAAALRPFNTERSKYA